MKNAKCFIFNEASILLNERNWKNHFRFNCDSAIGGNLTKMCIFCQMFYEALIKYSNLLTYWHFKNMIIIYG